MRTSLLMQSVAPDLVPADTPAEVWSMGKNVVFKDGQTIRTTGDFQTLTNATVPCEFLIYCEYSGQGFWVYGNASGIWANDGTTQWDIKPASGWAPLAGSIYTACIINGLVVVNASTLPPFYWNGQTASRMVACPGWPIGRTARAMRAHKNFLFAIGINETGGNEVLWSDAAGPGEIPPTWAPAQDNLAGSVNLAPLFEQCLDGLTMRDEFIIYKKASIWAASFTGGNGIFTFRVMFAEYGLAATNSVCRSMDDRHLFMAAIGDICICDGVRVDSVLAGRAQRSVQTDYTQAINPRVFAASLNRAGLGLIFYPSASQSDPTQALIYDFAANSISFRDMPAGRCAASGAMLSAVGDANNWSGAVQTWAQGKRSWNEVFSNKSNNDVLIGANTAIWCISKPGVNDFSSGPINATIAKMGLTFGDARKRKMISEIDPKITGAEGDVVIFRVMAQETEFGPITMSEDLPFTIGQEGPLQCFAQGRYLGIQVESHGGSEWRMGSIDIDLSEAGRW